jgi:tetraacyldisaccharide 4'-kinase
VRDGDWLRALWEGDSLGARAARVALLPAELLFGIGSALRSTLYSSGVLAAHPTPIPALAVGNLTVGGTGKTPIAAFLARCLLDRGATPGIVLRGYGEDEPLVHRTLNPSVRVFVSADRLAGTVDAQRAGCDVVVLDDAFQHRRIQRVADIVLVSADAMWDKRRHFLPAGPWREPLAAASRASLVIVTRKAAPRERADLVLDAVTKVAGVHGATVHLEPSELREARGAMTVDVNAIRGETVLAVSGIGDPDAFEAQLSARGANVVSAAFRDHHRFTAADASALATRASQFDRVVCTLKDAVKLGSLWPGPTPLWYVSQRVVVERGTDALDAVLATTLLARSASPQSGRPGLPGPPN